MPPNKFLIPYVDEVSLIKSYRYMKEREWYPIEKAQKDGILRFLTGGFLDDKTIEFNSNYICFGKYSGGHKHRKPPVKPSWVVHYEEKGFIGYKSPTHWIGISEIRKNRDTV